MEVNPDFPAKPTKKGVKVRPHIAARNPTIANFGIDDIFCRDAMAT